MTNCKYCNEYVDKVPYWGGNSCFECDRKRRLVYSLKRQLKLKNAKTQSVKLCKTSA